ncbi:MAG: kinase-like domain-containing protein [Piptocephalis tieghemiana]|nr:MAG: kinase-like domain-containing protein [Piptocephalis tieghemiana]
MTTLVNNAIWDDLQSNVTSLNELSLVSKDVLSLKNHLDKLFQLKEVGTEEIIALIPSINSVVANWAGVANMAIDTELNGIASKLDTLILSFLTLLKEEQESWSLTWNLPWNVSSRKDVLNTLLNDLEEADGDVDRCRRDLLCLSSGQSQKVKAMGYTPKSSFLVTKKGSIWKAEKVMDGEDHMIKFHRQKSTYLRELHALTALQSTQHKHIIHMKEAFPEKETDAEKSSVYLFVTEPYKSTLEMTYASMEKRPDVNYNRNVLASVIEGLKVVHKHNLVFVGLHPQSIIFRMESIYDCGTWKLGNFEEALPVGELYDSTERSNVDLMSPEIARNVLDGKATHIDPSLDVFLLGRLLYYISTSEPFWPKDLPAEDRLAWLADTTKEIPLEADFVQGDHTKNAIQRLLLKDPAQRRTLDGFHKSTYMNGGYNTIELEELKSRLAGDSGVDEAY